MSVNIKRSVTSNLVELFGHLPYVYRIKCLGLILLMIISSIAEVFSIGAVIPFVAALMSPSDILSYPILGDALRFFNIESSEQVIFTMTLMFCLASLMAAVIKLLYQWVQLKFSTSIIRIFALKSYSNIINLSFEEHVQLNSSNIVSGVFLKINHVFVQILVPCFSLTNSIIMAMGIITILLIINPWTSMLLISGLGLAYGISHYILKVRIDNHGGVISSEQDAIVQSLEDSMGSIKEIIMRNAQSLYIDKFKYSDRKLKTSQALIEFYKISPRYIVEGIIMIVFALAAYYMLAVNQSSQPQALASLTAIALAGMKLFPVVQNSFSNVAGIKSYNSTLSDVLGMLRLQSNHSLSSQNVALQFNSSINLTDVSYGYNTNSSKVLNKINMHIKKGSKVGIIGKTGSGKTTLIDLLMGLIEPSNGVMAIDKVPLDSKHLRNWRSKISFVPQDIFLLDATIKENIAFSLGQTEINMNAVIRAAKKANLDELISSWKDGYDTRVGERGAMISGGERQRIGIARALYSEPEILILDESTSALDANTEAEVMKSIYELNNTITCIIIAHNPSCLKNCTEIFELEHGRIINAGSLDQ